MDYKLLRINSNVKIPKLAVSKDNKNVHTNGIKTNIIIK